MSDAVVFSLSRSLDSASARLLSSISRSSSSLSSSSRRVSLSVLRMASNASDGPSLCSTSLSIRSFSTLFLWLSASSLSNKRLISRQRLSTNSSSSLRKPASMTRANCFSSASTTFATRSAESSSPDMHPSSHRARRRPSRRETAFPAPAAVHGESRGA